MPSPSPGQKSPRQAQRKGLPGQPWISSLKATQECSITQATLPMKISGSTSSGSANPSTTSPRPAESRHFKRKPAVPSSYRWADGGQREPQRSARGALTKLDANHGTELLTSKIINQAPRPLGRDGSLQAAKTHLDKAAAFCCQTLGLGHFRKRAPQWPWGRGGGGGPPTQGRPGREGAGLACLPLLLSAQTCR